MEILRLIHNLTKRKGELFSQATDLSRRVKTKERLTQRMSKDSRDIVLSFERGEIRWEEYQRAILNKALLSALTAVNLGCSRENSSVVLNRSWPIVLGEILPPLISYLDETETRLNTGKLLIGPQSQSSLRSSCDSPCSFIYSSTHFFAHLGNHLEKVSQGFRFMRRFPPTDENECAVCRELEEKGWQSIDSLPLPGRGCSCGKSCLCTVGYK